MASHSGRQKDFDETDSPQSLQSYPFHSTPKSSTARSRSFESPTTVYQLTSGQLDALVFKAADRALSQSAKRTRVEDSLDSSTGCPECPHAMRIRQLEAEKKVVEEKLDIAIKERDAAIGQLVEIEGNKQKIKHLEKLVGSQRKVIAKAKEALIIYQESRDNIAAVKDWQDLFHDYESSPEKSPEKQPIIAEEDDPLNIGEEVEIPFHNDD